MVIRPMLTNDPGDLTQLAEAVDPDLSLAPVAMPVRSRRHMRLRLAASQTWVRVPPEEQGDQEGPPDQQECQRRRADEHHDQRREPAEVEVHVG